MQEIVWGPLPSPPKTWTWELLMAEALAEAKKALLKQEVPIGSVVVNKQGEIVARAYNQVVSLNDPTAHAEILALRAAAAKLGNYRLEDCILAVSAEPCLMCAGAILQARLQAVVFGAYEEKFGAIVSNTEALSYNRVFPKIWHLGGILQDESKSLLQDFFKEKR